MREMVHYGRAENGFGSCLLNWKENLPTASAGAGSIPSDMKILWKSGKVKFSLVITVVFCVLCLCTMMRRWGATEFIWSGERGSQGRMSGLVQVMRGEI